MLLLLLLCLIYKRRRTAADDKENAILRTRYDKANHNVSLSQKNDCEFDLKQRIGRSKNSRSESWGVLNKHMCQGKTASSQPKSFRGRNKNVHFLKKHKLRIRLRYIM